MADLSENQLNEMIDAAVKEHDKSMTVKYDSQSDQADPAQQDVQAKMETATSEAPTAKRRSRKKSRRRRSRSKGSRRCRSRNGRYKKCSRKR